MFGVLSDPLDDLQCRNVDQREICYRGESIDRFIVGAQQPNEYPGPLLGGVTSYIFQRVDW